MRRNEEAPHEPAKNDLPTSVMLAAQHLPGDDLRLGTADFRLGSDIDRLMEGGFMKAFWRCFICNDIHYGVRPPDVCPTCGVRHAYVRISAREAADLQDFPDAAAKAADFAPEEFRRALEAFCQGQEFQLNPDRSRVDLLIEGLFGNAANHGLKYCPCRLRTKERAEDLRLVCPCFFTGHETYREVADGECWCGLFCKRR